MKQSTSKRSILIAHPSVELYGSDRVTLDTAIALLSRGWSVTVTTPTTGPLTKALETAGAEVVTIEFPVLRKSALKPIGFLKLAWCALLATVPSAKLMAQRKPDVVYVATITIPFWILVARLFRKRTVCHLHEAEVGARPAVRRLLAFPTRFVHTVIANSNFSLNALEGDIPRRRFTSCVIHNPVALSADSTPARETLDGPVQLLFVGRLSPRKGPHIAVEALSLLAGSGIDAHLHLLGDVFEGYEWFAEELQNLAVRLGVEDSVEFLGFRPDVRPYYQQADIALVPSTEPEPFGNTAVEAVLAGRPVVVSSDGGLLEAVDGYGSALLAEPGSAESLARALRTIVDNWADYRSSAQESAALAQQRHSIERYGDSLEKAL